MKHILSVMRGAELHEVLAKLPGYAASDAGSIKTVNEVLHGDKA
jgi:hypothetical protein